MGTMSSGFRIVYCTFRLHLNKVHLPNIGRAGYQKVTLRFYRSTNAVHRLRICKLTTANGCVPPENNCIDHPVNSTLYNIQIRSFKSKSTLCKEPEDQDGTKAGSVDSSQNETLGLGKVETSGKYCIVYTCKLCQTRSSKMFSKLAYHKGIVIVRCPGCESLHLIADNLGWFKHVEHRYSVETVM